MKLIVTSIVALALAAGASPAAATLVEFSGSRFAVDAPGPQSERCGTRVTSNIRHNPPTSISTGTSNLGAFTPTLSHCVQIPLSTTSPNIFDLGEFLFEFESGDTLFGTYSGTLTAAGPGQFSIFQTHLVTGGTGVFLGATGSFDATGLLSFPLGRPTVTQTFAGTLLAPAIPEPGTWAMLLLGFAGIGLSLRRARGRNPLPQLA